MSRLRVLMLSKACIVGIYQRKLEEIAKHDIDLMVVVPPSWKDERGETPLERVYTQGYQLVSTPIRFNGNFHLHYYPQFAEHLRAFKPDVVHIDEEPYNLATWHALYHTRRFGAKSLFFTWQNIVRHYPPPFRWGERWVLNNSDYAQMGTESAAEVWQAKGYRGPQAIIPQFGVDPTLFQPVAQRDPDAPFTVGYFGRLVPEKGLHLVLDAMAQLPNPHWRLEFVGGGPERDALHHQAESLGIADRVQFTALVPSLEMPQRYQALDAFVLPSLTQGNWKEQFGRVIIESMASGVPVVGSDSGAIPYVVGDGGLIFPEGDTPTLLAHLRRLQADSALRHMLGEQGRQRVLDHFTHAQVARDTVAMYQAIASG